MTTIQELQNFEKRFSNAIRALSIDMTNLANSGHQGTPLGFADVLSVLFNEFLNFAPNNPERDRLILSSGHASAMLYSAIYLTQKTKLSIEDLKGFRTIGGICQGHPDINRSLGIEMTTGALGQGIATSIGFAIALKKKKLKNSKVFVILGDGCLMEGVSHEALTLASKLNLNNLIVLFDNNDICIDGKASDFTTNNISRLKAYGFNVIEADGMDLDSIRDSLKRARNSEKPSFISFKTTIGWPSSKAGSNECHGRFMSMEEAQGLRESFGFSKEPFSIPEDVLWNNLNNSGIHSAPNLLSLHNSENVIDPMEIHNFINEIKEGFCKTQEREKSTRELGGYLLKKITERYPNIVIGGSADLSSSNCTFSSDIHHAISQDSFEGNYIHYGVREHAMGCIMNGLAIEGFIPYGGTFLVFSDYMRPAIRNASLMEIGPIFIFTHDSIAVGEDGKTHQPIEQLSSLRLIPNLNVMRPSCDIEVAECFEIALTNRTTPSALILSRQSVGNLRKVHIKTNLSQFGMYNILGFSNNGKERISIIATGSEVSLAFKVKNVIPDFDFQIISAPCLELFDKQDTKFRQEILKGRKLFLEAGSPDVWYKYKTRSDDIILGIDQFGESGSSLELFDKFGFNVTNIKKLLGQHQKF